MSSNEEDINDVDNPQAKKRKLKVQRACDICRRKKIRCDGGQMPGNRCSNCIAYNFDCTYVEAAKKRGPPKGYVEQLENRIEKLEKVLTKLYPGCDILKQLESAPDMDAWLIEQMPRPPVPTSDGTDTPRLRNPREIATSVIRSVGSDLPDDPHDEDLMHLMLADNLKRLSVDNVEKNRFFGKSSGAMLVHAALELKKEYTGEAHDIKRPVLGSRREEFWSIRPWERVIDRTERASFVFPEDDLMASLVKNYFEEVNLFLPLLHRPTFEKAVADGLHHRDSGFATNLLLVCAVGSRFSEDPRIRLNRIESFHSAGWKWFHQAQQMQQVKKTFLDPPSLYDLQFYSLAVMFLQGSSAPQSCWTMVGVGIRLAQDVGAHRRKYKSDMTVEDELWKRGFWVLVTMDRMISSALGRPCAIQDEDFDVEFPIECDDEYWENIDPSKRFKQPPNKPSFVTGFVLLLKLNQVLTILLRTIYSINKSKIVLGFVGQQWEQHIVAELDSALNKWVDSIPDHLRWDPQREDTKFFHQSASLYCNYYYIQILIHRSFIPSPRKPSPLSFPSLAICTNAARSCSHIADIHRRRGLVAPPQIQTAVFMAGCLLLLNIWGGKRSGLSTDPSKEMNDVQKCMQVLRKCETRWHTAGRLWDIIYELASVGDLPLPNANSPSNNKRDRDSDSPGSVPTPGNDSPKMLGTETPRTMARSRRATSKASPTPPNAHPTQLEQTPFPLPLYSDELGRFPVNSQSQIFHVPQPVSPLQDQGQNTAPTTYWGTPVGSSIPSSSTTAPYPQVVQQPTFNPDMFNQIGYGYDPSFIPTPLAANYGTERMGTGSDAMIQQPLTIPQGQGTYGVGETGEASNVQALIDSDTVAMWSTAPTGFELDDWGTYLSNVSELTQGMYHMPPGGG